MGDLGIRICRVLRLARLDAYVAGEDVEAGEWLLVDIADAQRLFWGDLFFGVGPAQVL